MKKMLALALGLLVAMLPLVGFAAENALVRPYEIDDQGDDDLKICLPANATTGYEWTCEILDTGIVALASTEYETDDDFANVGAPGVFEAEFRAVSAGKTRAIFSYARSFEEDGPVAGVIADIRSEAGLLYADAVYWYEVEDSTDLHLYLDANATTGYEWSCDLGAEPMMTIVSESYLPDPILPGYTGSGGAYSIHLTPDLTGEGLTELTFRYAQPWDAESEPARTLTVNVWQTMAGTIMMDEIY